jgi:hypothetical protein
VVPFSGDHFRCCVAGRPTSCLQGLASGVGVTETEINDLDVVLIVQQQIFWLQVAVANARLVNVLDARNDLLEKFAGFRLLQFFSLHDVLEKFTA